MSNAFKFAELSNKHSEAVSQQDRHQFGEPVVSQLARELSPHSFATESEERKSNDKLKVRQVFWLLDEAGDQMEFLNLTLKGVLKNKFGNNFLRIVLKDMMHKGMTYASGALGSIMGGLVGGLAGGTAVGIAAGKTGSKAYKNLERGFASKNPKWKIKSLYPSTSNIDKAISNAYMQRDNKSLRNNDATRDGFSLTMKVGGGVLNKILPVSSFIENIYTYYQASKGLSEDKINKINLLLDEVENVTLREFDSSIAAFERLNINELNQNGMQKFNALTKFKKAEDYIINRENIKKKRDNVNAWVEENRQLLIALDGEKYARGA
ncbi:hypothetical protein [Serratia entomophila]|uniref:hypothetical protein n=1 Tax=Serratia entomophila TaxID=42906 RepID=UPI0021BB9217|nr:hypothetical protein [Serratia entomophila]